MKNGSLWGAFGAVLKNQPVVWVFALIGAVALRLSEAITPTLLPFTLPTDPTSFEQIDLLITQIERLGSSPVALSRWAGSVALTLIFFWIILALNQAGLIHAAAEAIDQRKITLLNGWRYAVRHLGKMVVVDTLAYLPLFLLVLVIVSAILGVLLSFIYFSPTGEPSGQLNAGVIAAGVCLIPASLLLPLATLIVALVRAVALRLVLIKGKTGREAMRAVKEKISNNPGDIGLAAFGSLLIFAFISLVLSWVSQISAGSAAPSPLLFFAALLEIFFITLRLGLISILWTITVIGLKSPDIH